MWAKKQSLCLVVGCTQFVVRGTVLNHNVEEYLLKGGVSQLMLSLVVKTFGGGIPISD